MSIYYELFLLKQLNLINNIKLNIKCYIILNNLSYQSGLLPLIFAYKNSFIETGWFDYFKLVINSKKFRILDDKLIKDSKVCNIYPNYTDVFNAFLYTPFFNLKVILLGQDPYHTKGAAHGLAFSHPNFYTTLQPSLRNIYKELTNQHYKVSKSGNLEKWADQGVFLINTALTVIEGKAKSHSLIWQFFTTKLFKFINNKKNKLVVLMWGKDAQNYDLLLNKFYLLKCAHPSPLSAHYGFFGNNHFILTNQQLTLWGLPTIDWNLTT